MSTDANLKIVQLKDQLEHGDYQVDSEKVAEAILRRRCGLALLSVNPWAVLGAPRPMFG